MSRNDVVIIHKTVHVGPSGLQMYMWALRGCKCTCGPSGAANVHVGPQGLQMYMWALRGCKCTCGPSGAANVDVGPQGLQIYMWALRGCKCTNVRFFRFKHEKH